MPARRVAVIGAGYVGLTTAACLASLGHDVVCADVDAGKVDRLAAGVVDLAEPGLADLVAAGTAAGRLRFVLGAAAAVGGAEVVMLCVPTPMGPDGSADLTVVESVVADVRGLLAPGCVLVAKSTVPIGTTRRLAALLGRADVPVVGNPEFLRECSTVTDFLRPDRIVIGADDRAAADRVAGLYAGLDAPVLHTDPASAELIKYASNCFLAMKLSYANAVAELCERFGADMADVGKGMGMDHRIGPQFLAPGPGWGGSCLPKDTVAMVRMAATADVDFALVRATVEANTRQHERMVAKIRQAVTGRPDGSLRGVRLGLLGLAFKAGTADLRDSPALAVATLLRRAGATLVGYDPAVPPTATLAGIELVPDAYRAALDADALVVLTEWPQFDRLDWARMAALARRPVVVDTRNLLDPGRLAQAGLSCAGVGRPDHGVSADLQWELVR
ncbi:UDP-glucose dehydrogenase family protein [Kutzneria kofuensis]|uniref:UDP-glucose 6-dehydrogenase n=1 Tax=Kutzneria kofuensis TaxID=103725 RepID=A0A7W9KT80_9PSEU|nr:UDP-glucose/GDP-mannose dehydrogenase family protein [Kutzneria kofuensis]MBB5898137.1 UDPglucose 6-dehydrogenase [Kutzneria kofuensis]